MFCRSLAKATIGFTYDNSITGDLDKDDGDSESDSDSVLSDIGKIVVILSLDIIKDQWSVLNQITESPFLIIFMVETDDEIHSMYVSKELHKECFG